MTNFISKRLDRLETELQKEEPAYGAVFRLIDNPRDPDNEGRLAEAARFKLEHPHGMLIHRVIVGPPNGHSTWEQFHAEGSSAKIAKQQSAECGARHRWPKARPG